LLTEQLFEPPLQDSPPPLLPLHDSPPPELLPHESPPELLLESQPSDPSLLLESQPSEPSLLSLQLHPSEAPSSPSSVDLPQPSCSAPSLLPLHESFPLPEHEKLVEVRTSTCDAPLS
jgi:hypothetical protein